MDKIATEFNRNYYFKKKFRALNEARLQRL